MILDDFNRPGGDPGEAWTATRLRNTTVLRVDSDEYALNSSPFSHNAAYTAIGWFYLDVDTNAYTHIFHIGGGNAFDGNTDFVGTNTDGTTLRVGVYGGSSDSATLGLSLSTGQWYKCAIVRESVSILKVYIEPAGTPLATVRVTNTSNVSARAAATRLQLGSYNSWPINGRIGGWRFWTSALSVTDINTEFASLTPLTSNAWASLSVDGTSVTALLTDQTTNARDFTQVGALSTVAGPTFKDGKFAINGNEIEPGALTSSRGAVYTGKKWARAQSSSVIVRNAISGDSFISLWLLCNPNGGTPNGYQVSFSASNWYITRVVNGTGTDIQTGSWTLSVGTRVTARVNSNGRLSIETGTEVGNVTDTTHISGYPGVEFYTTSTLIKADDWQATGEYEDAIAPTTTGELKDVSIQGIEFVSAVEVSSGTYTWDYTNLPEGDGCLFILMMGWNISNDGYCISASLNVDGDAQTITPRLSNGGNCDCQYLAFPRITSKSQRLTLVFVRPGVNNMHARPHMFKVVGHDTERMVGAYGVLSSGSYTNVLPPGNAVLVTYSEGGNASGGTRDWESIGTNGYSTGLSKWVGRFDATSVAVQSGYTHNVVEIRRGEKQRRSRIITDGGNEYAQQPQENEPAEANPKYDFNFLWTPSKLMESVDKKGYAQSATSTWIRSVSQHGRAFSNDTLNYNGGAKFDIATYSRKGGFSFLLLYTFRDAESGLNLMLTGTGGDDGGIGIESNGKPKLYSGDGSVQATNGFSVGQTAALIVTWTPSLDVGKKIYLDGVLDPTTGSTIGSYGFFNNTAGLWIGGTGGNQTLTGDILIASMATRPWTETEIRELSRNPWSAFVKPRRTIFTGAPVITHKQRRIL